ncbi:HNH endonuclease [Bosea sp. RAC05]|uniref:HNH endonuclease n=1 Tax=Bosea sp. RAC05 TaxID=1842539 RepID=UPI00083D918E|nr:HNH endonuclease [Bosea sp. RAC05]AOG02824.1 HNH endonuclease family protein [Bosea sp. RAC05]
MGIEFPALVLNADCRPLSYTPLSLWGWEDAVKAVLLDRVSVMAEYDEVVRSPSFEMRLPSVILLRQYVDMNRRAAFSRFNLSLRDGFACAYCGDKNDLTFDHVHPRSRGGPLTFENIVLACMPCNGKKGNRTPEEAGMTLRVKPYAPTQAQLVDIGKRYPPPNVHKSWIDHAYWDVPLDPD